MVIADLSPLVLRIVMPCGGCIQDMQRTLRSISLVAVDLSNLEIEVYRVFNNGLSAQTNELLEYDLNLIDLDINPAASAALARNAALDYISRESEIKFTHKDYTLFLDAGDILLPNLLREISESSPSSDIAVGGSLISTESRSFRSIRLPLFFKYVMNPIYLGSALVTTKLACSERFLDGRKEDWKYWLCLLDKGARLIRHKSPNYIYTVVGRAQHSKRKSKLFKKQYEFYRGHLQFGRTRSVLMLGCHYLALIVVWWVVQPLTRLAADNEDSLAR